MSKVAAGAGELERRAERQTRDGVKWLARAGYATRGFLYLVIGGLAALAAFGHGGALVDAKGALQQIYAQPFGQALLLLAAVGLFGYAVFLFCRALIDPEGEARQSWGPARRVWWFVVGLLHVALGVHAIQLLGGNAGGSTQDEAKSYTAQLLAWTPVGPILIATAGMALLIGAVYELFCAWRAKLDDQLDLAPLASASRRWVIRLSRAGIAARALVGIVAAVFLVVAAATSSPREAKSFGESLQVLRSMPLGSMLFGAVTLGLLAFGFYQLIEARYRRVLGSRPS